MVSAGGTGSLPTAISAASTPGPCVHPLGLFPDELARLDEGKAILAGTLQFGAGIYNPYPQRPAYTRQESFDANFQYQDAFGIYLMSPMAQLSANPSCSIANPIAIFEGPGAAPYAQSPAGLITLTAPSGLPTDVPSNYSLQLDALPTVADPSQLPAPIFVPGPWVVSAPGGDMIGPFRESYQLPPQVRLLNRESLTSFGRDADLPIIWDPQGYSPGDRVLAILLSANPGYIECTADALSGQLVIPAKLLQQLTPAAPSSSPYFPSLQLIFEPAAPAIFRVPLNQGGSSPTVLRYVFSDRLSPTIN
jgi:hypothetical protein